MLKRARSTTVTSLVLRKSDDLVKDHLGVLSGRIGAVHGRYPRPPLEAEVADLRAHLVQKRNVRAKDIAPRGRINAGREAVHDRAVLHQRHHGAAARSERRSYQNRRFCSDHVIGELNRGLRIRLVVVDDEMHALAVDAPGFIDCRLNELQRLLLFPAEESPAAGQPQNHIDVISLRGSDGALQRQSDKPDRR